MLTPTNSPIIAADMAASAAMHAEASGHLPRGIAPDSRPTFPCPVHAARAAGPRTGDPGGNGLIDRDGSARPDLTTVLRP